MEYCMKHKWIKLEKADFWPFHAVCGLVKNKKKKQKKHTYAFRPICHDGKLWVYRFVKLYHSDTDPNQFWTKLAGKKKKKKAGRYPSFILKYFLHIVRPSVVVANISIFAEICVIK